MAKPHLLHEVLNDRTALLNKLSESGVSGVKWRELRWLMDTPRVEYLTQEAAIGQIVFHIPDNSIKVRVNATEWVSLAELTHAYHAARAFFSS